MNEKQTDYFTNFRNTVETLQNRRQVMNASYLTAMTLLISVITFIEDDKKRIALALGGMVLSFVWIKQLSFYKAIAKSKFMIIDRYEKKLKLELNKMEYQDMVNSKVGSDWEKFLPGLCILIYLVILFMEKVAHNG